MAREHESDPFIEYLEICSRTEQEIVWKAGFGGRIKPATTVAICIISSCESLDNPAEEDVSMVDAHVVGELDAGVSSAIPHVEDKHRRSTDRVACCHVSLRAKKLVDRL